MFKALIGSAAVFGTAAIDSSHVEAHRSAGGGKAGPSSKRSGARAAAARPRSTSYRATSKRPLAPIQTPAKRRKLLSTGSVDSAVVPKRRMQETA